MNRSASDRLLFEGGSARFDGWVVVVAGGADRERFLHSQLTSDVKGLAVGGTQQTALLDRAGRLQGFGFLCKRATEIVLLLPAGAASAAVAFLEMHVIADDVYFEAVEHPQLHLLLGAEAARLAGDIAEESAIPIEGWGSRGVVTWGPPPPLSVIDTTELEARRVLSGVPEWGVDARAGQLIHETALIDSAVSFTKGCYLGQETVAKVASGRGAARGPVILEIVGGPLPAGDVRGQFSIAGSERAGEVLAVVEWQGTGYVAASVVRGFRVAGMHVEPRWADGGSSTAVVRALPVVSTPDPTAWASRIQIRAVEKFAQDCEDEAVELLERAIAVCPGHADSYESLGVILGRHHRYDEAISLMKRLLEVEPASVMAHTNLSLYYNRQGRIEDAEREAGEAMRAKMEQDHGRRRRDEAERERDASAAADRERRAEMFRQVLALDPDDALGNFGLGDLLVEEGRYREAVEHLEKALRTDPKYSAAFLSLGNAHEGAGDRAAAADTYRRGIEVAAARGDLSTANKMQERLAMLNADSES